VRAVIEAALLVLGLVLVAACGAFVAAEFSLVTVDRATVEQAAETGDKRAEGVRSALRTLSTELSSAQVGITLTNLLIGFLAEPAIADLIRPGLEDVGITGDASTGVSLVIALVASTAVTMIFGELVPKNLAIARPLATARAVQGLQRGFTQVMGPLIRFTNGTANRILRRVGVEPQEELASARSAQELVSLVDRSARQGTLPAETAALLQRSLTFGDRRAGDAMTPRTRMHVMHPGDPVLDVLKGARRTGRSRFPVLDSSDDVERVLGLVHVKDAMRVAAEERSRVQVAAVMGPPVLVPESVELDALLEQLRRGGRQLAVVVDEFGGVAGVVTLEDLIEEIVGDVRDEHDRGDPDVRRLGDGRWLLSGLLRPDEVASAVGVQLPEDEEYETLGGLITMRLGRLPAVSDSVQLHTVDGDGHAVLATLDVRRLDGLRVDRVELRIANAEREDSP
jgi:CBS domain containing-hemolysin-like protein